MKYRKQKRITKWPSDEHLTELLKKGGIIFSLRIVGAGLSFLFTLYLARLLGATDYGFFMLLLTVIAILSVTIRMGLDNLLVKNISAAIELDNLPLARGYFKASFHLVLILGSIVTFFSFFLSPVIAEMIFQKPEMTQALKLMVWVLLPISIVFLVAEGLKGLKQAADATIAQNILIPGSCLMLLLLGGIFFKWELKDVILVYSVAILIALFYATLRWREIMPHGDTDHIKMAELVRSGLPLLLATSGGLVMSWADTVVLGIYHDAEMVGIYTVASKTVLVTGLILVAVNTIAAPKYAAFYATNNLHAMATLARQAALFMTGLIVFPTLLFILIPEWILKLFGVEYTSGSNALVILAIGQFINVACGSVGYILMMSGHENTLRNIMLITAALNVALNILLVQHYGMNGVAFATAVSLVTWNIWMLLAVKRHLGFWPIYIPCK